MYEAIIYQHPNYQGKHHHIFQIDPADPDQGDSNLVLSDMNDRTSSIVVKSGKWDFYEHINFEGINYNVIGPGMYSDVRESIIGNDAVSSVDLISPSSRSNLNEIILFEHANFRGKHHHIYMQDRDLSRTGMDNNVSSVVVISGNWVFYASKNFDGKKYDTLGLGLYEDVEKYDILHDVISSVKQEFPK